MAQGDITFFDQGMQNMLVTGWLAADDIECALLENTTPPTAGDSNPALGNYTEVTAAGSYTAGGVSLGTYTSMVSFLAAVTTIDSAINPSWTQNASNTATAYWALLYDSTRAGNEAFAFVDLGGPVDMGAADLTITWNASGIATIT